MRTLVLIGLLVIAACRLPAADSCMTIHGRAHLYGGDGQLRIWHIGTHHDYTPDESSWGIVTEWLEAGITKSERDKLASPASALYLFAEFVICPTEPFKNGSVQRAIVKSASHRHYVHIQ
jgi:hypothetical protein